MKNSKNELLAIIETFKTDDNKGFYEQININIKNKLKDCKKFAPNYYNDEFINSYSDLITNRLKEDISSGELDIKSFELNQDNFISSMLKDFPNDVEKQSYKLLSDTFFKELGNGDIVKGKSNFEKLFLSNKVKYNKYYDKCEEFKTLCDSMSDENKKQFKKMRDWDNSGLSEFYKWVFIISFFFISIPYFIIKKLALKSKNILSLDEFVNNDTTKEMFLILSKGDYYK